MSRVRNGPDRIGQTETVAQTETTQAKTAQTETPRWNRPSRHGQTEMSCSAPKNGTFLSCSCQKFLWIFHNLWVIPMFFYEEWVFLTCFHLYLHVFEHNHCFFLATTQFCFSPVWRQKWGQKCIVSSAPQNAPRQNSYNILKCRRIFSGSWIIANILPQSRYIGSCGHQRGAHRCIALHKSAVIPEKNSIFWIGNKDCGKMWNF